jgi:hypothetical protein
MRITLATTLTIFGACLPIAASGGAPIQTVALKASRSDPGRTGQAILVPRGAVTDIAVWFSSVPNDTTLPAHVYTYLYKGTCNALPGTAAIALNRRVLVSQIWSSEAFRLTHTVQMPIDALRQGGFALVLRTAPADGNRVIYCGEVS